MKRFKKYLSLSTKLFLLVLIILSILDIFTYSKGSFAFCKKIAIGDTIIFTFLKNKVYKDESSEEYYITSTCNSDITYLLEFSRNIIIPRISKITIRCNSDTPFEVVNEILLFYGFDKKVNKETEQLNIFNKDKNVEFNYGRIKEFNYVIINFVIYS